MKARTYLGADPVPDFLAHPGPGAHAVSNSIYDFKQHLLLEVNFKQFVNLTPCNNMNHSVETCSPQGLDAGTEQQAGGRSLPGTSCI